MRVKIIVSTNRVGSKVESTIELDGEDIVGLSDEDAEEYITKCVLDEMINNGLVNWSWWVEDE